jgi:uncharacterized protein (UPF0332 family)
LGKFAVQPNELVKFAKRLLDDRPDAPEADCRQAAHAAYYAVYHLACKHCGLNATLNAESSHSTIRSRLLGNLDFASAPPEIRRARQIIKRLYIYRSRADYNLNEAFTYDDAIDAIDLAASTFERIAAPIQVAQLAAEIAAGAEPPNP